MKIAHSPRCVSSLSQPTSRAPEVTAKDTGARASYSGLKPIGSAFAAVLEKAKPQ
jgi:hypothetical protein